MGARGSFRKRKSQRLRYTGNQTSVAAIDDREKDAASAAKPGAPQRADESTVEI
jgi:hypothetical protein